MAEALAHPYLEVGALPPCHHLLIRFFFQAYHDPEDEPTAEPIDPSFFDFDSAVPLPKERLKGAPRQSFPKEPDCDQYSIGLALIYNEVVNHHHKVEAQ